MASRWTVGRHQRIPSEKSYQRENCRRWGYECKAIVTSTNRYNTTPDACRDDGIGNYLQIK